MYAAVERLAEFYQTTHFMAPEFLSVKVVFTSSKNGSTSNQSCPFIAREQKIAVVPVGQVLHFHHIC
jgi:hypothetical protein